MEKIQNNRIESLDWLRGLMAISIMTYHYLSPLKSESFIGKLGIYGVSIFFVLSGLSMAIVYNHFIKDIFSTVKFFLRRFFRIAPMMAVATFLTLLGWVIYSIINPSIPIWKLFLCKSALLNYTALFGFIKPDRYIPTGAWSIGNEMVYYALTPIIFFLYNKNRHLGNTFTLLSVIIGLYFAFFVLNPSITLEKQWLKYINPFNNFFLYCSGVSIYYNFKDIKLNKSLVLALITVCIVLFNIVPGKGDQINIVTGFNRVYLVLVSILITFLFYKLIIKLPKIFEIPLENFGIATYSVYLLHPIIYTHFIYFVKKYGFVNNFYNFIIPFVVTILLSIFVYKHFEEPFIKIGKMLTSTKK